MLTSIKLNKEGKAENKRCHKAVVRYALNGIFKAVKEAEKKCQVKQIARFVFLLKMCCFTGIIEQ